MRMAQKKKNSDYYYASQWTLMYDLEADPHEMNDLIEDSKHAADLKALREGLAKAMYRHGDGAAPWFCKMNHLFDWEL